MRYSDSGREKIFANRTSDRGLASEIQKELSIGKTTTTTNLIKRHEETFYQRGYAEGA